MSSSAARRQHRLAVGAAAIAVLALVAGCGQAPTTSATATASSAAAGATAQPGATPGAAPAGSTPGSSAQPTPAPRDFITTTAASQEVPGGDAGVVRSRVVDLHTTALPTAAARTPHAITLPLFDDTTVTASVTAPEVSPAGYRTWNGRVDGDEGSSVVLVLRDGVLSGLVNGVNGTYRLQPQADGSTRVEQVDQAQFPTGDEEVAPPTTAGDTAAPTGTSTPSSTARTAPSTAADGTTPVVDILVGYTAAATSRAGGQAAMEADIALLVEQTNTAFTDSGINAQVNLVHSAQVATNNPVDGTTLGKLANPGDGVYDELNVQRDQYGADLVALIVDNPGGSACGIAYLMNPVSTAFSPYGMSVTDLGCGTGNMSFTHELGHNFGASHDRGAWAGTPAVPYGYGWVNPAAHWRTVMAYTNACPGCVRLLRFSNPDQTYNGAPMGAPAGAANAADNRSVLNASGGTVASLRGAPVPPSFALTAPTSGQPVPASGKVVATWTATGNVGSAVKVELLRGSTPVSTLSASAPLGTGRFEAALPLATARGDDYRVKVTPLLAAQYAATSEAFSVVDPTITPASTLASATEGGTGRVTWTYTGAPGGAVKVELLKDGRAIAVLAPAASLGAGGAGGADVVLPAALADGDGYRFRTTLSAAPVQAVTARFAVTSTRRLVLTAPAAGATVTAGAPLTVTWTASGNVGTTVRVDLLKGGAVVASSPTAPPASTSLTFTPPGKLPTGTDYTVQLVSVTYPTVVASGSGPITVNGSSMTVTSQATPSAVTAGRQVTIAFTSTGAPGTAVQLQAVAPNQAPVTVVASVALTAGQYTWTVPVNLPRGDWRIRATVVGNALVTDTSAASITVSWPTIAVTGPAAGVAGGTVTASWSFSDGAVAPVRVRLMQGTTAVTTLSGSAATAADGTGSLTYRLPVGLARGTYQVEVAAAANPAIVATSATPLSVSWPTIAVASPAAAVAGANLLVSWTLSDGVVTPVRVRLMQGATAVTTLSGSAATAADGTGSLTYRLPLTLAAGTYQVEVAVAGNTGIVRTSTELPVTLPSLTASGATSVVRGQTATITWAFSGGAVGPVRIDLVQGSTVVPVTTAGTTSATTSTGSFAWRAPTTLAPGSYTLRIRPAQLPSSSAIEATRTFAVS